MTEFLQSRLRQILTRELLLDLEDRGRAEAARAHEMVKEKSGLDRRRARELEGQARFRMMEHGFEEVCRLHGGQLLEGGIVPTTDLKVFQPFMHFVGDEGGVILGLAAMPEPGTLPTKNRSRLAGVKLNYFLSPRLDLDGKAPKIGDVFALLLFSRDHSKAGLLEALAVGAIDAEYSSFIFYKTLDNFLAEGPDVPSISPPPTSTLPSGSAAGIKLKEKITPFQPPEAPEREDERGGSE